MYVGALIWGGMLWGFEYHDHTCIFYAFRNLAPFILSFCCLMIILQLVFLGLSLRKYSYKNIERFLRYKANICSA